MKITKEMGYVCLKHLEQVLDVNAEWDDETGSVAWRALDRLAGYTLPAWCFDKEDRHYHTALAMCAAIAGVKPEDVE